jgi:replication-associated recombination protein RarA
MRPRTFDVEDGTVTLIGATTENPYSADLSLRAGLAA